MAPGSSFGNFLTNQISYMANALGQGRIPYTAPPQTLKQRKKSSGYQPISSDQLPPGAYMTEAGRVYGMDSTAAGRMGGYMDEAGRVFVPSRPQMPGPPGADFPGEQGMFTPAAPGPRTTPPAVLDPYAAQNRAYQQERARVEAMVKANPDMQKQEIADARAKVRDQGMAAWAAANPELAKKLQRGQVGYDAIQGTLAGNMARAGQGFGMAEQLVPTPQGFPTQVPGLPTGAGYSTGFGMTTNLAPGVQTPPPYSTIRPSSELSGLGAAPLGTAQTSTFGQPNVMDPEQFEKLLKMVQK